MTTSIELWSGAFGAVLAVVVQYVLSRRDQDQMKYLNAALQKAMQNNQENYLALSHTVEKMMTVLDKLADSLRPAAREAMSPIDRACERIDLYADGARFMTLDPDHRFASGHSDAQAADKVSRHVCVISEFDMTSGACLVSLKGEGERIPAVVVDPRFSLPNNPYVEAMAARYALPVLARLERDAHGIPTKVFILDTSEPGLDFLWR